MNLTVLDLFSGIGGFSLGLERAGFETVAFCEIEPFCQKVLHKHWPDVPLAHDIRKLTYDDRKLRDAEDVIFEGQIDLVCGGFPCQPYSIAGHKKGTQDNRDLWPEMFRVIQQSKPTWVIGENVTYFTNMAFTRTKSDLESEGYTVQPFIIPACAVGAPHRRDRIWIVAYRDRSTEGSTGCGQSNGATGTLTVQEEEQRGNSETILSDRLSSTQSLDTAKVSQQNTKSVPNEIFASFWNGCEDELPPPIICREDDGFPPRRS